MVFSTPVPWHSELSLWSPACVLVSGSAVGHRKLLDSACTTAWSQCGGVTCVNGSTTCSDSAYTCCPSSYSCLRQNQWYWQCLPQSSEPGAVPYTLQADSLSSCFCQSIVYTQLHSDVLFKHTMCANIAAHIRSMWGDGFLKPCVCLQALPQLRHPLLHLLPATLFLLCRLS